MKNALKAICVIFMVAVLGLGYYLAADGGVSYEFVESERIEDFAEGQKFTSRLGKVVKNDTEAVKEEKFTKLAISQTYKCNVALQQAEWRLIEEKTGVPFTKTYKDTVEEISGQVPANEYAWVEFTPEVSKITGYIVKKSGGKETKTYVEIVYPKANPDKKGAPAGEVEFKTSPVRPAEKLS